jgi:hypothetical protein
MAPWFGGDIDMRRCYAPAFKVLRLTFRLLVLCHFALARRESVVKGRPGKDFHHHHHPSRMLSSTSPLMQVGPLSNTVLIHGRQAGSDEYQLAHALLIRKAE